MGDRIQKIKEGSKKLQKELRSRTLGYILTALGLVAGLAWNDTIKAIIEEYFPTDSGSIKAQLIYAILVTVVVVIISIYLTKLIKDDDDEPKKN
ncbi:MAG: DUF5654 family protein [Patescibacteria group bacterium]